MDTKKPNKKNFQEQLEEYFLDVEPFSNQHLNDIKKFSRLLESMKNSHKSHEDGVAYKELKNQLEALYVYLKKYNITLNDKEQKGITAITGSGFTPVAKKRMMEDIIHKIMVRTNTQKRKKIEEQIAAKEIESLSFSRLKFVDWLKLTFFAIEHKTITPLTHRIKGNAVYFLKNKVREWEIEIRTTIMNILDNDYYALSPLEYNSIEALHRLSDPFDELKKIKWKSSYDHHNIAKRMDRFTKQYITIIKNRETLENALDKILKIRKTAPGFQKLIDKLLDKQAPENKTNTDKSLARTVKGILFSYYTSRLGVVVKTINQIIYILCIDPTINDQKKLLTENARINEEKNRVAHNSKDKVVLNRYQELERIIDIFLESGDDLEESLIKNEAKGMLTEWRIEHKSHPLLRVKRLVDIMIKYFTEVLTNEQLVELEFDNEKYTDYFSIQTELVSLCESYTLESFGLIGSKEKEFVNIQLPKGTKLETFFLQLTAPGKLKSNIDPASIDPTINFSRSILQKIANKSYEIAQKLNEIISYYQEHKRIIHSNIMHNYDFYANASMESPKLKYLLQSSHTNTISIKDFFEKACTFAFQIASVLNHPGIDTMRRDKQHMQSKIELILKGSVEQAPAETLLDEAFQKPMDREIYEEINSVYKDRLTGLWKMEYLEDQLLQKLYDSKRCFKLDISRFLFMLTINGFHNYLNTYGQEFADELLTSVVKILTKHVYTAHKHQADILLRYNATAIIGFINSKSLLSTVDFIQNIVQEINAVKLSKHITGQVTINCGIYQERFASNVYDNIKIVFSLMNSGDDSITNNIIFAKNPEQVISNKDIDRWGRIDEKLLTIFN